MLVAAATALAVGYAAGSINAPAPAPLATHSTMVHAAVADVDAPAARTAALASADTVRGHDMAGMSGMQDAPADPSVGTLSWLVGGVPRPVPGSVPVTGDVVAIFDLRAGPTRGTRLLDVHLLRAGSDRAVNPQSVSASGDMRDMPHGAFRRTAEGQGGGMYRLELPLEMPGVWDVTVQILDSSGKAEVRLSIDLPS